LVQLCCPSDAQDELDLTEPLASFHSLLRVRFPAKRKLIADGEPADREKRLLAHRRSDRVVVRRGVRGWGKRDDRDPIDIYTARAVVLRAAAE